MADKIIFWFSADLLPYCLSYFFQKKFDGELFGIYDLSNKPKKFFKEQNTSLLYQTTSLISRL